MSSPEEPSGQECTDPTMLLENYDTTLSNLLNKHFPVCHMVVSPHYKIPWLNNDIWTSKMARQKAERKWQKLRNNDDWVLYIKSIETVVKRISKSKRQHYCEQISEFKGDQKLFKTANSYLIRQRQPNCLTQRQKICLKFLVNTTSVRYVTSLRVSKSKAVVVTHIVLTAKLLQRYQPLHQSPWMKSKRL